MSELFTVFYRTVIIYAVLVIVLRLSGKRQIGELQISELITAVLLSEIAASPITTTSHSLLKSVVPIVTLVSLEVLLSFATTKSQMLKKLVDGRPSIIINRGRLDRRELSRLRMSVEELISECRQAGCGDIADIEYAILEENGKLSVFEKAQKGERETGIAHTLVVDGNISETGLIQTGCTREKLLARLKEKGVTLDRVFLYTVNDAGEEHIVKK